MTKLIRPSKKSLKNPQHFEFIDSFIKVVNESNFTAQKIVTLMGQLRVAFAEEDRWYMVAKASEIVAQRTAADKRRDDAYSRLHAIVRAWAGSGINPQDEAATLLKKDFTLYKVQTAAQLDVESGQLSNLIIELERSDRQSALTTLQVSALYAALKSAHEEVQSLRLEQAVEQSEKVIGALASARKRCDQLYDDLTYLIEAYTLTAENPAPYEAFIKRWNGTLKIYQDILDRKSGTTSSSSSSANAGTTTPDTIGDDLPPVGEGGTDTGSGSGSGSGSSSGSGSGSSDEDDLPPVGEGGMG